MINNADNILFRCSALGHIMSNSKNALTDAQKEKITEFMAKPKLTDKQAEELDRLIKKRDNPELSDTCKTHLIDVFVSEKYGRKEEISSKFIEKGNAREEDAITLLSRSIGVLLHKNKERLRNKFIQGEPDLFMGKSIFDADVTIDTKVSWSAHTFFRAQKDPINPMYYWQGAGYMALSGAKKHLVAYCLVNGTEKAISDEKKNLAFSLGIADHASENYELYIEKCKQIEINHIFDIESFKKEYPFFDFANDVSTWSYDIPMKERLFVFEIERDEDQIGRIYKRVRECRDYMNENLFQKETEKILP